MSTGLRLEDFADGALRDRPAAAPAAPATAAAKPATAPGPAPKAAPPAPGITPKMLEQARVEGYEAGYKAGWDDAAQSDATEREKIDADFARNLQDLGFTFHEARAHVMDALEPLLAGMVKQVLPQLVAATLGQTIVEELLPLATEAADTPIEVVVAPASRAVLENLLQEASAVPFALVEEPTLAPGQVFLRTAKSERQLDFASAIDRIETAIAGLYDLKEKAFRHG